MQCYKKHILFYICQSQKIVKAHVLILVDKPRKKPPTKDMFLEGVREGYGKMTYEDLGVYEGEWEKGVRKGYGKMTYENGDVYKGKWKEGVMEGYGKYTFKDLGVYEGELEKGVRKGYGKMTFNNKNVYEGEWKGGVMEGIGKMTFNNKDVYEGEWKKVCMDGHGKMTYKNGDVYKGEWKKGVKEGYGEMTFKDLGVYKGEWKGGVMEGHGEMTYKGGVYKGEWKGGVMEGHGKYTYESGNAYEGKWKGGVREGYGKMTFNNGDVFEGEWKGGKIKQNRTIKKIPLDNAENILLQNIEDIETTKTDKEYFTEQNTKKNKSYIDITKNEKVPQENTNKKDHLKIIYSDHGIQGSRKLNKPISDLPNANGRKSYYISDSACLGAFVDPDDNNLIDKIKEKIKGTDAVGFFSHILSKNNTCGLHSTIDKNNQIGLKRTISCKGGVCVNDKHFNEHKDEFFHYYCILNEGERQNVYKIPHQLCYWRETLIDDKHTSDKHKYPNKFMEALDNLKQGKSFTFTTKAQVDIGDKFVEQNTEITISGKIEKVEVITHDVIVPRIKVVQSEYQSKNQSINNIKSVHNINNNNITNNENKDSDDELSDTDKEALDELHHGNTISEHIFTHNESYSKALTNNINNNNIKHRTIITRNKDNNL